MGRKKKLSKGIFCLEGDWTRNLKDRSTVEPILRLLEYRRNIPYIHRDIGTREEFDYYLSKWPLKTYARFPILYLAFHGTPDNIWIPERSRAIEIPDFADLLKGRCGGRVVHFGACSTLDIHGANLNSFLAKTEALAVSGFTKDVNFTESSAFDLLYFHKLQDRAFNRPGLAAVENDLKKLAPGLIKKLGFRMKVSS